jgi:hypothetical protein
MSEPVEPLDRNPGVRLADDDLPARPILLTVAGVVVVTVVLVGAAAGWLALGERAARPSGRFPEKELGAPTSLRGLEERLFEADGAGQRELEDAGRALRKYGWADRERRLVRPPIDRAIADVVAEASK